MKLRKAIAIVLCIVMSLSLFACGKDDADNGDNPAADDTYTVTFDVGDAANAGVTPPAPVKVKEGEKITLPKVTWEGHKFLGWYDGETLFSESKRIRKDYTLLARWRDNAAADKYEANLSSWSEDGHLYIHYKRFQHNATEEGKVTNTGAPNYDAALQSSVYSDWGIWVWKTSDEGRLFNGMKVDESGVVYDIKLDQTYDDAGWDEKNHVNAGITITYKDVKTINFQIHSIKTRYGSNFWKNDGSNNEINLTKAERKEGGKTYYHWFVIQSNVPQGSATYGEDKQSTNPFAGKAKGSMTTRTTGADIVQSNRASTFNQITDRVKGWEEDSVGYQIFIASFCDSDNDGIGDLQGIISKLDYLESLNVDVLWLTPFQSSTNYHGYDIKDYYSVDSRFGTLDTYRELVYKAHKKGMKIVMDFVLNHTSQNNPWFVKSRNLVIEDKATGKVLEKDPGDGSAIDYRQFYNWINQEQFSALSPKLQGKEENHKGQQWYGPLDGNDEDGDGYYFYSSFSSELPELNFDYQPVRDAILDVCYYWMEFGLDGFRLDAVKHIYMKNEVEGVGRSTAGDDIQKDTDDSFNVDRTRNYNFYREFNYKLKQRYPNAFLVGENLDGNPENVGPYYQGIDSQFNFNLYYDVARSVAQSGGKCRQKIYENGSVTEDKATDPGWLGGALNNGYGSGYQPCIEKFGEYAKKANFIDGAFTSNHDLPRARDRMNIKLTKVAGGSIDDEYNAFYSDGTMDGSKGGTLDSTRVNDTEVLLRIYYALQLSFPGITWIYYGDEIGMSGIMQYTLDSGSTSSTSSGPHEDRVYRQPMKWKASGNASFKIGHKDLRCELVGLNATSSLKSVEEQSDDSNSLLSWVKTLTGLRDEYGLGKGTLTYNGKTGFSNNIMTYTVRGSTGTTLEYKIYTGQSSAITGTKASYDGVIKINNVDKHYGVAISVK